MSEATRALIEEVDLGGGWLHVRNKPELGWMVKTGHERSVPLLPEVVTVLRGVIGTRIAGPVFLRPRFLRGDTSSLAGDKAGLEAVCRERVRASGSPSREAAARVARGVWSDAGAVKADAVRTSFIRVARSIGRPGATCPKSWRHTFATLLQDANVDPLVRQVTLGHRPSSGGALGMTAAYTHTRPETQRRQVEEALRRWPEVLALALERAEGGAA